MKKGVVIATVMGLGMLYVQAASADEMVRYDHALFIADASEQLADNTVDRKSSKHARNRHYHRHNYNDCRYSDGQCGSEGAVYMPSQGMMPMTAEEMEPHMDIMDRAHGPRGGRR